MKVLLVGTLPPRGGVGAVRFAKEAARRSALGDSVETLSGDPLSISHRSEKLDGRRLPRQLRALSGEFDAVELRLEADLGLSARSAGSLTAALRAYRHVTIYADSPIPFTDETGLLAKLWSVADVVVVASEADLASLDVVPVATELVVVGSDGTEPIGAVPPWPEPNADALQPMVLQVIRRRARGQANGSAGAPMLVTATARVHPSFRGSSIWLAKRVIGKSRGAVTRVLRPTPRQPG